MIRMMHPLQIKEFILCDSGRGESANLLFKRDAGLDANGMHIDVYVTIKQA